MYEAVILDPWVSCGVADRIAELEMLLFEWYAKGVVERGPQGRLPRGGFGAREADAKSLVDEGIAGALTGAQHLLEGPEFSSG